MSVFLAESRSIGANIGDDNKNPIQKARVYLFWGLRGTLAARYMSEQLRQKCRVLGQCLFNHWVDTQICQALDRISQRRLIIPSDHYAFHQLCELLVLGQANLLLWI